MKNLYKSLAFAAIAAATLISCNKEPQPVEQPGPKTGTTVIEFNAQVADPSTKATLTPNEGETEFTAAWEGNDELRLIVSSSSDTEETTATWDATKSVFSAAFQDLSGQNTWTYKAIWPVPSKDGIDFGSGRVQNGNAYNSAYDVMFGSKTVTAEIGMESDNETPLVVPMNRLTGIAYFHITSSLPDGEKVVSATLKANNIAAETVSVNTASGTLVVPETKLNEITITFEAGTAPSAQNFQLWFNVLPGSYSGIELTIVTDSHTATLKPTATFTYTAGKLNKAVLSNLTWEEDGLADKTFFEERFTNSTGTMGWSGNVANGTFIADNDGWTTANEFGAGGIAKFGTGSSLGFAETPSITINSDYIDEDIILSFKAGAWENESENTTLKLSCSGASITDNSGNAASSVTMTIGEWTVYSLHLTDIESPIKIKFEGNSTSKSRFFLDDVLVYYGEKPSNVELIVSPFDEQSVNYEAGSIDYSVVYKIDGTTFTDWTVSTVSDGFSVEKNQDASGFTVSYTKNEGSETRTGSIVVSAGSKEVTVSILQNYKVWYDLLTATLIDVSSYSNWNNLSSNTEAKYAGNSTKNSSGDIQLRATNPSGIVSTASAGLIKKVTITWGTGNPSDGRTLDIYGSNTAYESAEDLYDNTKAGTKVASLKSKSGDTEYVFTNDYRYVGVRSNSGALYLADIKFTWGEYDPNKPVFGATIIGDSEIASDVTTGTIQVTGNVDWTASATNGATLSSISGNGEKSITVTMPENTSYTDPASYVVTISTTAEVTTKTYELTFTQAPAIDPNQNDGSLEKPFTTSEALTILSGYTSGQTSSESYYISGKISQVDSYNDTYKSITYYISDDGETTNQLEVYSGKNIGNTDFSAKTDLSVGDVVIVYGKLKDYNGTKEIYQNNYLYSRNGITKLLTSISVNNPTTSFTIGDPFSFDGTVTATYTDQSTTNVTANASFSGYNMSSAGNQTVTVSYTENGVTKTTSYSISVRESGASITSKLTLSSSKKFGTTSGSTLKDDQGNTWTCTGESIQNSYQTNYSGQQFGTSSTNHSFSFTSSFGEKQISSISIKAAAGSTTPTYTIKVNGQVWKSGNLSKTSTEYTATGSGSGSIEIILDQNNGKKAVYLGEITVVYK